MSINCPQTWWPTGRIRAPQQAGLPVHVHHHWPAHVRDLHRMQKAGSPPCQPLAIQLIQLPWGPRGGWRFFQPEPLHLPSVASASSQGRHRGVRCPHAAHNHAQYHWHHIWWPPGGVCSYVGQYRVRYTWGLYSLPHIRHKLLPMNHLPSCEDVLPMRQQIRRLRGAARGPSSRHKQGATRSLWVNGRCSTRHACMKGASRYPVCRSCDVQHLS